MAWLLQSGRCDVALLGAFAPEQLDDGLGALELTLDRDDLAELDRVSRLPAPYPMNFWNTFCYRDSEHYGGLR